jgi:hypothetical protein
MGFRCRWLATRNRDRLELLARLRFQVIAEIVEEIYDPGLFALEVDDWLVVIGDGFDYLGQVKRAQAANLSDGGDVVYLFLDDGAMAFGARVAREVGEGASQGRWTESRDRPHL